MQLTSNYGLKKPEGTDIVDIADFNANADLIDTQLKSLNTNKVDKVTGKQLSTNDYTTTEKNKLAGIAAGAQVNAVTSVAGKTGVVAVTKSDVGLGNVDNTSDANKPISTATQTALNNKVNIADMTKGNVGLGSVENYGIATQAEAEAGTLGTKYMTPQRTQQAINKNLAQYKEYALFLTAPNVAIAGNSEVSIVYDFKRDGDLNVTLDANDKSKLIIPETGLYLLSSSFVFGNTLTGKSRASLYHSNLKRIGIVTDQITNAPCNVTGLLNLNAGDVIQFRVNNLDTSSQTLIGANNNVNYLLIKKVT